MKTAIMQPYFFPYIGYFQLIAVVDLFILYDNVKYTKRGWINRNRMLQGGRDVLFSLPLKRDSDDLDVCERSLAVDFKRAKLLNRLKGAYRHAPHFVQTFPLIEEIICFQDPNLFRFLRHSIVKTCEYLCVTTEIRISSSVAIDHHLKNQDRVLALCAAVGADAYVNAVGGMELYSKEAFRKRGIDLKFLQSKPFEYKQFGDGFVPWLSIIDVMMFNPIEAIREYLDVKYELI